MNRRGFSQSELGRRVGVSQSAIHNLLSGEAYGSKHLHRIARELGTTPAYLTGEVDDPDEGAPPPPPEPSVQTVMMPVELPGQRVLAHMFEGLLLASPGLQGAELAHELARHLPRALGLARRATIAPGLDLAGEDEAAVEALANDLLEPRRAQRR
jgi:transcriptional regulator with XRE-family HTH domain